MSERLNWGRSARSSEGLVEGGLASRLTELSGREGSRKLYWMLRSLKKYAMREFLQRKAKILMSNVNYHGHGCMGSKDYLVLGVGGNL